jgi:hypothetical protein
MMVTRKETFLKVNSTACRLMVGRPVPADVLKHLVDTRMLADLLASGAVEDDAAGEATEAALRKKQKGKLSEVAVDIAETS